jgi:ACT domain-containing protein
MLGLLATPVIIQVLVGDTLSVLHIRSFVSIQFAAACAIAIALETFTKQIDNLVLPLYFYAALLLLCPA